MSESPEWCQWAKQEIEKLKAERDELEARVKAHEQILSNAQFEYEKSLLDVLNEIRAHGVKGTGK